MPPFSSDLANVGTPSNRNTKRASTSFVEVGTDVVELLPADSRRTQLDIENEGTSTVRYGYINNAGLRTSGFPLKAGQAVAIQHTGSVFCVLDQDADEPSRISIDQGGR